MQEDSVRISLQVYLTVLTDVVQLIKFGKAWYSFGLLFRLNDDDDPVSIRVKTGIQHNFNTSSFLKPRFCDHCGKMLKGFRNQVFEHEDSKSMCIAGILMQESRMLH